MLPRLLAAFFLLLALAMFLPLRLHRPHRELPVAAGRFPPDLEAAFAALDAERARDVEERCAAMCRGVVGECACAVVDQRGMTD